MSYFTNKVENNISESEKPISDSSTSEKSNGPEIIKCLLDCSGSMIDLFQGLIVGQNSLILEQRQCAEDTKTNPIIEIWVFNNSLKKIRSGPIKEISDILEEEVTPNGGTALNDAIASILNDGNDDHNVLFFIFTDGQENSSVKYRGDTGRKYCKELIERYSHEKNWTVIFGAANIDAYKTGMKYGINSANAFSVSADAHSITNMMRGVSDAVRTSSSSGGPIDISLVRQSSAPLPANHIKIESVTNRSVFQSLSSQIYPEYLPIDPSSVLPKTVNRSSTIYPLSRDEDNMTLGDL